MRTGKDLGRRRLINIFDRAFADAELTLIDVKVCVCVRGDRRCWAKAEGHDMVA